MRFIYNRKKIIAVIISAFFAVNLLGIYPTPARALFGVGDTNFIVGDIPRILEYSFKKIGKAFQRVLITRLNNEILTIVQNKGLIPGTPAWITDWRNYLTDSQYRGEGVGRIILANTNFCSHILPGVAGAYRLTKADTEENLEGRNIRVGASDPFTLRGRCTMPDDFNLTDYLDNPVANGGLDAFERLLEPQNNIYGSSLMIQSEMDAQVDLALKAAEDEAARGYTGIRSTTCRLSNGKLCNFLETISTPPDKIAQDVSAMLFGEQLLMTSGDALDTALQQMINSAINRLSDMAKAGLTETEGDQDDINRQAEIEEFCTAGEPRIDIVMKYIDVFAAVYPEARRAVSGPFGRQPVCGKPDKENISAYTQCITQCMQTLGAYDPDVVVPNIPLAPPVGSYGSTPVPSP